MTNQEVCATEYINFLLEKNYAKEFLLNDKKKYYYATGNVLLVDDKKSINDENFFFYSIDTKNNSFLNHFSVIKRFPNLELYKSHFLEGKSSFSAKLVKLLVKKISKDPISLSCNGKFLSIMTEYKITIYEIPKIRSDHIFLKEIHSKAINDYVKLNDVNELRNYLFSGLCHYSDRYFVSIVFITLQNNDKKYQVELIDLETSQNELNGVFIDIKEHPLIFPPKLSFNVYQKDPNCIIIETNFNYTYSIHINERVISSEHKTSNSDIHNRRFDDTSLNECKLYLDKIGKANDIKIKTEIEDLRASNDIKEFMLDRMFIKNDLK